MFIALGGVAFWAAIVQRKRAAAYAARAVATQAVVLRLETSMPGREMTQKTAREQRTFPVLRFAGRNGQVHEARSRTSCPFDDVELGQTLDVLYDPDTPNDVRIGMSTDNSLVHALIIAGFAVIALGVYGMIG
jgi:hypothetical protein